MCLQLLSFLVLVSMFIVTVEGKQESCPILSVLVVQTTPGFGAISSALQNSGSRYFLWNTSP